MFASIVCAAFIYSVPPPQPERPWHLPYPRPKNARVAFASGSPEYGSGVFQDPEKAKKWREEREDRMIQALIFGGYQPAGPMPSMGPSSAVRVRIGR